MDRSGGPPPRSANPDFTGQQYQRLASQAITLVQAMSVCMFSVAAMVRIMPYTKRSHLKVSFMGYLYEAAGGQGEPSLFIKSFANALGILSVIAIANCALAFLYKGGHYDVVRAWLMTSAVLLLFVAGHYYMGCVLIFLGVPADHFSCALVTWNAGILGVVALYLESPCLVQRCYIVYVSVLVAVAIEEIFSSWTSWILLVLVSLWDVFTVLCVQGPTRMIIETAKERNEALFPALAFSIWSVWCYETFSAEGKRTECGALCSLSRERGLPQIVDVPGALFSKYQNTSLAPRAT
ncbi:hypothetical protein HPB50_008962 [Hyalomma asiaticum]|uniref:Uncharacterized protein n=1 Tax=Hyalomma asiaticum TaxID=266040 RepID=A0ACB7S185_HYAAI|nr:hypothetical protein HPB50_008962 [Hyalomma asiaticum]